MSPSGVACLVVVNLRGESFDGGGPVSPCGELAEVMGERVLVVAAVDALGAEERVCLVLVVLTHDLRQRVSVVATNTGASLGSALRVGKAVTHLGRAASAAYHALFFAMSSMGSVFCASLTGALWRGRLPGHQFWWRPYRVHSGVPSSMSPPCQTRTSTAWPVQALWASSGPSGS